VTSSVPAREGRLRRSLRDDSRGWRAGRSGSRSATVVDGDVIEPATSALSAWSAAASREHRNSVDVDALAMAVRQRAAAADRVAVAGKESGGAATATAGGGLSLSSTASNDTGYSSIGNSGERPAPCRAVSTDAGRVDVDDQEEPRPSVAELRQRFQTHSISQPAELSKRCVANLSPALSAGSV